MLTITYLDMTGAEHVATFTDGAYAARWVRTSIADVHPRVISRVSSVTGSAELIRAYDGTTEAQFTMASPDRASHAYAHLVGTDVGIRIDGIGIVRATVTVPEPGQDDNVVTVVTDDMSWHTVPYMSTYRADFVNATVPVPAEAPPTERKCRACQETEPGHCADCGACPGQDCPSWCEPIED